jgi:hypothetical protein
MTPAAARVPGFGQEEVTHPGKIQKPSKLPWGGGFGNGCFSPVPHYNYSCRHGEKEKKGKAPKNSQPSAASHSLDHFPPHLFTPSFLVLFLKFFFCC